MHNWIPVSHSDHLSLEESRVSHGREKNSPNKNNVYGAQDDTKDDRLKGDGEVRINLFRNTVYCVWRGS